jgi:hypothetical protein
MFLSLPLPLSQGDGTTAMTSNGQLFKKIPLYKLYRREETELNQRGGAEDLERQSSGMKPLCPLRLGGGENPEWLTCAVISEKNRIE